MQQLLCRSAHLHGYDVLLNEDNIFVLKDEKLLCGRKIPGLGGFIEKARDLKMGWGQFEHDGDEVIYIYDKADSGFGYALNLDDHGCSEWGYAPLVM